MKRFLTCVFVIFISGFVFSQTDTTKCDSKCSITPYIAGGISIPNTSDFRSGAYASTEVGVMYENISVAGVFGRNNLTSTPSETINNYWYEGKILYSFPIGYGVFGVGSYIATGDIFIEYGLGISKSFGNIGTFIQSSSWDGVVYVTPGLSYSF